MKVEKPNTEERLIQLIKQARVNFLFNPDKTKSRLMQTLADIGPSPAPMFSLNMLVLRYSAMALGLIVVLSGGVAFAASGSDPGDVLFTVNKLSSRLILSMPIGDERRAMYYEKIAADRLESLTKIEEEIKASNLQVQTKRLQTIAESDQSINQAIETVAARKKALQAIGQTEKAERLGESLSKLEVLAGQYEAKIHALESQDDDEETKNSINAHLKQIQNARNEAALELNRQLKN